MELCPHHLDLVMQAIHAREMDSLLVNKRESELRWNLAAEDNGFYPETFDPMLAIKQAIFRQVSTRMMDYGQGVPMDMGGCPICIFDTPQWIGMSADAARKFVDTYCML